MHKIILFSKKNNSKKICVPALPKIFRPVTRNTLILFGRILCLFMHIQGTIVPFVICTFVPLSHCWPQPRERSGSVVECLTLDQRAAGSSLTGITALWSLSKTHLS